MGKITEQLCSYPVSAHSENKNTDYIQDSL